MIRIDDERIKGHLDRVVRATVEKTLSDLNKKIYATRHMPRILAVRSTIAPEFMAVEPAARIAGGQVHTSNSFKMPAGMKRVRDA